MPKLTRIEEVKKKIYSAISHHGGNWIEISEKYARQIDKYYCQLFTQPLEGGELLAPKEREIALDDMRERASCGDSEQEPSLDDCIYIGSVYQLEKDKTKPRASPQPL